MQIDHPMANISPLGGQIAHVQDRNGTFKVRAALGETPEVASVGDGLYAVPVAALCQ